MLQIWLLGQFVVQVDGRRVVIPSRAAQSLFAFLVLNAGTMHRREKLAGMLWPDTPDENARRSLRQELWRLRKAVTPVTASGSNYILAEELALGFNASAEYWLDVTLLERERASEATSELMSQVALYRGELLPGFYDDWVGLERERIFGLFERRMQALLDRLIEERQWKHVLEWSERWIALGQTPEPAYRALMIAYAALGDPSKATLAYERCIESLKKDLGLEPSAETRALFEELTHREKAVHAPLTPLAPVLIQPSGTVTFLFSDIEGSTQLLERLGDQYASLLAEHRDLLLAAAEKHGGHEVDTQGDAFFFAFFRAADAVAFAAEAQRALAAHVWPENAMVRVRMGLHTGEPILARTGYVGMDVHRAARVGAAGHGGQVLLSQTTSALVESELPSGTHLQDLGEHRLKDIRYPVHIVQLTIEGLPSDFPPLKAPGTGNEPPTPGEPPFKGLQFFDENDADLFFGREALTAKLVDRLRGSDFLAVVVGASGSGKSSIVRAGLIPALRKQAVGMEAQAWRVYILTPTAHPLEALATALTHDSESVTVTATLIDDLSQDPRSLYLYLKRKSAEGQRPGTVSAPQAPLTAPAISSSQDHVLLVVDQFEELFTLCREELEREQFIDNLLEAVTPGVEGLVTLVLTIRADFYAHLAQYEQLREAVAQRQEYIGPMNPEELRRAIEEPAQRGGWEFEPGLVDLILRDVGEEPGALPLLSHALLETWKRRSGTTMTLKGYADAGGVRGAIARTAEATFEALDSGQQAIARNVFMRLTELGEGTEDTRRRASMDELIPREDEAGRVRNVIASLTAARLITTSEHGVEVAHEALIREWPRLREWLTENREGLRMHRHLTEAAQEWESLERDPGALYRGTRLAQAEELADTHPDALNELERAFLQASQGQEQRDLEEKQEQQRRELQAAQKLAEEQRQRAEESTRAARKLRQRALWLAGAFALALALALVALYLGEQSRQSALAAQRASRVASAREFAASAISNLDVDPERSTLLALQAVATTSTDQVVLPEAEQALHRAVQASHIQFTLQGYSGEVDTVAYSPDGTQLATITQAGTTIVWDTSTGKQFFTIPGHTPRRDFAGSQLLAYSPDGSQLATRDDSIVHLWDSHSGKELRTLSGHQAEVWAIAYSPDGKRIATGGVDRTIKIWNAGTGQEMLTLDGHSDSVSGLAFSPDGKRLASASWDQTAKEWDSITGKELMTLAGHTNVVLGIAFSPDGNLLATTSGDATTRTWNASTGAPINTFANGWLAEAFSADGKSLATGNGPIVTILDVATGRTTLVLAGHTGDIKSVAFSPDGKHLASGSTDKTVKIWDITPDREVLTLWVKGGDVNRVAYSPDGTRLAIGGDDGIVRLCDAVTGEELFAFPAEPGGVYGIAFNPAGTRIAVAYKDKIAKVWDISGATRAGVPQPNLLLTLRGHTDWVRGVAYSPDGRLIATGGFDQTVRMWDAETGQQLLTLSDAKSGVTGLAFSPNGGRIAAAYLDGTTKVWDVQTANAILTLSGHNGLVWAIAYSPDGSRIATASSDSTVKVWDAASGKELYTFRGHSAAVWSLAFSRDGTRIAAGSLDNNVQVWDAVTGQDVHVIPGHTQGVFGVAFSPDGRRLATASSDGTARVYLLKIDDLVELAKTRLTRSWTAEECRQFLHVNQCPPSK